MRSWMGVVLRPNGTKRLYWSMELEGLGRSEAIDHICEDIPEPKQLPDESVSFGSQLEVCSTCEGDPVDTETGDICPACNGACMVPK